MHMGVLKSNYIVTSILNVIVVKVYILMWHSFCPYDGNSTHLHVLS